MVNAAGGDALNLYRMQKQTSLKSMPFKGLYLKSKMMQEFSTHISCAEQKILLGIHTTITCDNYLKLGPTAIPVLSNKNYKLIDGLDYESIYVGLNYISSFLRNDFNIRLLSLDEISNYRKINMIRKAKQITNADLRVNDFEWNVPGIRAQLFDTNTRELVNDFIVEKNQKHNTSA